MHGHAVARTSSHSFCVSRPTSRGSRVITTNALSAHRKNHHLAYSPLLVINSACCCCWVVGMVTGVVQCVGGEGDVGMCFFIYHLIERPRFFGLVSHHSEKRYANNSLFLYLPDPSMVCPGFGRDIKQTL